MWTYIGSVLLIAFSLSGCATTKCAVCEACPTPQEIHDKLLAMSYDPAKCQCFDDGKSVEVKCQAQHSDIVMLGDSLIEYGDWSSVGASNMGIGGNTIADVKARLSGVTAMTPKTVILEVGINDVYNNDPDTMLAEYQTILDGLSGSTVIINTVPHVADSYPEASYRNSKIDMFNSRLIKLPNKRIDLDKLLDPNTMTKDGIHPNQAGYDVWIKAIKDALQG